MASIFSCNRRERKALEKLGRVQLGTPWEGTLPQRGKGVRVRRQPELGVRLRADRSQLRFPKGLF